MHHSIVTMYIPLICVPPIYQMSMGSLFEAGLGILPHPLPSVYLHLFTTLSVGSCKSQKLKIVCNEYLIALNYFLGYPSIKLPILK